MATEPWQKPWPGAFELILISDIFLLTFLADLRLSGYCPRLIPLVPPGWTFLSATALLTEWLPRVYRFAMRLCLDPHLAEDLTQETFLRAWRRRGQLRSTGAIGPWLFQITANLWKDHLRRGQGAPPRTETSPDEVSGPGPSPQDCAAQKEQVHQALQAMDALPDRQREVLYLHACEGLNGTQISSVLDISLQAVKASLSLARKKMRELLKDKNEMVNDHASLPSPQ